MSRDTPDFDHLDELLAQVWEQGGDAELRRQINEILDGDPRAQQRYLEQQLLHADLLDPSGPLHGFGQTHLNGDKQLDEPDWITQLENGKLNQGHGGSAEDDSITGRQLLSLAGYVLGLGLTSKAAYKVYAVAAAVVLVVTLFLVFGGGNETPTNPIANQDPANGMQADPRDPAPEVRPDQGETFVATITADYDAKWQTASGVVAPSVGDRLTTGRLLALTQGGAQITTGCGTVVSLQGPAIVRTHAESRLELIRGKLIARCETPESKGYTVFTDTAEITDIGTVFGVQRDESGQTTTGVLSGHVVLAYKASDAEPRLLKAGEFGGVSATGQAIVNAPEDMTRAFRDWATMLRPVTVTGDALFVDSMPNELPEDEQLVRVYRETTSMLLEKEMVVSRTEPGLYRPVDGNQQTTIAAGTRVDSYFVHIDRPRSPANFATRQFTIKFDQPVVALVVHTELLAATTTQLGVPGVKYLKLGGLGLVSKPGFNPDNPQVDSIQWSDDRKTLTVTLNVQNQDQFRVLTLSPEAASADGNRE